MEEQKKEISSKLCLGPQPSKSITHMMVSSIKNEILLTTDRWTFNGLWLIVLLGHSLQPFPIEVLYNGEQLANGEKSSCGKLHDDIYVWPKEVM